MSYSVTHSLFALGQIKTSWVKIEQDFEASAFCINRCLLKMPTLQSVGLVWTSVFCAAKHTCSKYWQVCVMMSGFVVPLAMLTVLLLQYDIYQSTARISCWYENMRISSTLDFTRSSPHVHFFCISSITYAVINFPFLGWIMEQQILQISYFEIVK